jgi:hypothetical protein
LLVVSALVLVVRKSGGGPAEDPQSNAIQARSSGDVSRPFHKQAPMRPRKEHASADTALAASLQQLWRDGELEEFQAELSRLADSNQLAGVTELLRTMCREGEMEHAQWCLLLAGESDPELHLRLCAEALSNPSEVIRESASAHLENASGMRFPDSARASAWLAGRRATK